MKKTKLFTTIAFLCLTTLSGMALEVTRLTCEMTDSPLAVPTLTPRLGWQLTGPRGAMQSAYRIEVYDSESGSVTTPVWDSGKITSDKSQLVTYSGPTLHPGKRYTWRVKVWDESGNEADWSKPGAFRTAPDSEFLKGSWIGAVSYEDARLPEGRNYTYDKWKIQEVKEAWDAVDSMASRSILLRKDFRVPRQVADATV